MKVLISKSALIEHQMALEQVFTAPLFMGICQKAKTSGIYIPGDFWT